MAILVHCIWKFGYELCTLARGGWLECELMLPLFVVEESVSHFVVWSFNDCCCGNVERQALLFLVNDMFFEEHFHLLEELWVSQAWDFEWQIRDRCWKLSLFHAFVDFGLCYGLVWFLQVVVDSA